MRILSNKILLLGVVALVFYTITSLMDGAKIRQQRELEREAAAEKTRAYRLQEFADVKGMIDLSNADAQWVTQLCDSKEVVLDQLLTIDAEEAWIQENPIYFSGSIDDVRGNDDEFYEITVSLGRNLVYSNSLIEDLLPFCYVIGNSFRLKLKSSKEMLNPHMERISSLGFWSEFYHTYGLVAKINNVSSEPYLDENGDRVIAIVGEGSLINIRPLRTPEEPLLPRMTSPFPTANTTAETQSIP